MATSVHPQHAPFELPVAPKTGGSLLGGFLRSQAVASALGAVLAFLLPNLVMLVALGFVATGAWLAGPIPGCFTTGGMLLVLDLKIRG